MRQRWPFSRSSASMERKEHSIKGLFVCKIRETQFPFALASCCYCNKLLPTQCLKTTKISYSSGDKRLKISWQGYIHFGVSSGESTSLTFLASSDCLYLDRDPFLIFKTRICSIFQQLSLPLPLFFPLLLSYYLCLTCQRTLLITFGQPR